MRGIKPSLALAAFGIVGLAFWAQGFTDPTPDMMATAAGRVLDALSPEQLAQAGFDFDSPERLNWHFIPRERKGLSIKAMTPAQRALTFGLLRTGLGADGYLKATTIMSLEQVLKELEQGKGPVRDPELYFLSVFGKPSGKGKWGWRVEGHHLSLNFTLEDGKIVSATPVFFGANPAEIRQGPRQGLRTLGDVEDRALRFLQSLSPEQRKVAVVEETAPKDVRAPNTPQPPTDPAVGIAVADLSEEQRGLLRSLVEAYAEEMPVEVSQAWAAEIRDAGTDGIKFAWFGLADRSQPHAYRVQGPTFLIEFNNTQNGANHVHSLWRSMLGDFGVRLKAK